jgi:hypothetical protein
MPLPSLPTAAEAVAIADMSEFNARFSSCDMPFCPVGMIHLRELAREKPTLYDWAREYAFANFDQPGFSGTLLARHLAHCEACAASC